MELIVRHGGETVRVVIERRHDGGGTTYELTIDDRSYRVDWSHVGERVRSLLVAGRQHEVSVTSRDGGAYEIATEHGRERVEVMELLAHLAETSHAATEATGRHRVTAYMPGRVVGVLVDEGAEVDAGQGILVLEAMKMENEIQAERAGTVRAIFVEAGQAVEGGDPLYEIE